MNPLYKQYGQPPQGNPMEAIMQRFQQFRQGFSGNPQQIIQQMLNSGRITQDQLNAAVQQANQMARYFKK